MPTTFLCFVSGRSTCTQCQHTTRHCITSAHRDGDGTAFAFGGRARADAQLSAAGRRCGATAERQMSTHASSACIGGFHHNAAAGRGGALACEQRHEPTRVLRVDSSGHIHMTTKFA